MTNIITDYKGDSATIRFTIENRDITDYKIICEIWDNQNHQIKKATANAGGGDNQIKIIDADNGRFDIYIDKYETSEFGPGSYIEVAVLFDDEKDTIYKEVIMLNDSKIDWESV